jgi:hypothetical protein
LKRPIRVWRRFSLICRTSKHLDSWIGDAERIVEKNEIRRVGAGHLRAQPRPRRIVVEPLDTQRRTQQPIRRMKRDVAGVRLAERGKHRHAAAGGSGGYLGDDAALSNTGGAHHPRQTPMALHRPIQHRRQRRELPLPADQRRRVQATVTPMRRDRHQRARTPALQPP